MSAVPPRPSIRSLWLPIQDRAGAWCAAAIVLSIHAVTMARDLTVYDSAELALAAERGGLGHPPGQPLHTMLGWLFAHLPGVPPLIGLTLLSALPSALTVLPVVSLAEQLHDGGLVAHETRSPEGRAGRVLRLATAIALAVHPSLWETASRVEIYGLSTFLAMWAVSRIGAASSDARGWFASGVGLGLSASVNPVIATFAAVAAIPSVIARRASPKALLHVVAGGALALLFYLYVPLVGGRDASVFVWGAPSGGQALSRFLRGADFSSNVGVSAGALATHVGAWTVWSFHHGLLPVVVMGLAGWIWRARQARGSGLGIAFAPAQLALALAFVASNAVFLADNPDYLGYLAGPLFTLIAGASAGVSALAARGGRSRAMAWVGFLVLAAHAAFASPSLFARTRSHDHVARMLSQGALDGAPRGAIVVVSSDHWVFPLLWLQEAEERRPDVVVVPFGLASSSWYWAHLFRRHPDLPPIDLHGPGGSRGRVRRLIEAQPSRPILLERIELAAILGLPVCANGWLLEVAAECARIPPEDALTPALERSLHEIGRGSPSSDAALTQVAYDRGEAMWRLGHGAAALAALLAGVEASNRPVPTGLERAALERAPPLRERLPVWQHKVALGDPARNLYVAALLLRAAGDDDGAARHMRAAQMLGLPEAR